MTKEFKTTATAGAARFISTPATQDTQDTQPTTHTFYRLNLKLDGDLKEFLSYQAWRNTTSITSIVNDILHAYKEQKEAELNENTRERAYYSIWKQMQDKKEGAKE